MAGSVCPKCGQVIKSGQKIIHQEGKAIHYPSCPEGSAVERKIPLNLFLVWKAFGESAKECASTLGVTVYDKVYMPKIAECVAHRMKGMTADIIRRQHPEWVEEYERMLKGSSGAPDLYTDRITERPLHKCWFGEHEFSLNDAKFCETCQTYKCPICGGCYCNLSPEAKEALDAEMFTLGLWKPYGQPCRRKRRSRDFFPT